MHVYFTLQDGAEMPKSSGVLQLPESPNGQNHIEIKATGRQVVIPPSIHPDTLMGYGYHIPGAIKVITSFEPIAAWIEQYNQKPEYEPRSQSIVDLDATADPVAVGEHEAYARAALANMAADLASMGNVEYDPQNDTLNKMAWKLAHFVARGDLSESECRNALLGAMSANGYSASFTAKQAEKSFDSGFSKGYGDRSWTPEVYLKPVQPRKRTLEWKEQRKRDRTMPGDWQAYEPSGKVVESRGVTQIGRTKIVKRSSLFSDMSDRLSDDKHIPSDIPIRFPLKVLHKFGGMAKISQTGKIAGMVGASGSGKTSALETIADAYNEGGTPVWIWTPEWSPTEMTERCLQRHGGVTMDQLREQDLDNYNVNVLGRPSDPAARIPENQWTVAAEIFRKIRGWAEDTYFMHNVLMTIDEMGEVIADAKGQVDVFPRVLIADYVQLLKANEVEDTDEKGLYGLIQRYKAMCEHFGLFGWVATQVTKAEATKTREGNSGVFKGTAVVNVTKNSLGITGRVRIPSEPSRLRIIDQEYHNQNFDKDAFYLGSQSGRYVNDDPYNLYITLNPEYL